MAWHERAMLSVLKTALTHCERAICHGNGKCWTWQGKLVAGELIVRYARRHTPPFRMTERHLTLNEAEKFTGKSRSTLRRFVEGIVKQEAHQDRELLLPTVAEVADLKSKNQPFSWRVSESLLKREFKKESAAGDQNNDTSEDSDRLVRVLEKSIAMLETELIEKNKQIGQFQERQREFNVLLRSANEQLAIAAAGTKPATQKDASVVVDSESNSSKRTSPKADASERSQQGTEVKERSKEKKSFWHLFRSHS